MLLNALTTGPAELLGHPGALGRARFDRRDPAVALARVVVAGVDDDELVVGVREQAGGEIRHVRLGNRHDDHLLARRRLRDVHRGRSRLALEVGQGLGAARVGDLDAMAELGEAPRQDPPMLPAPMMPISMGVVA